MNPLKEKTEKKKQEKNKEKPAAATPPREELKIAAYSEAWNRGFNTQDFNDRRHRARLTAKQAAGWLRYMSEVDWTYPNGRDITPNNCLRSMRMWRVVDERIAHRDCRKAGETASRNGYEAQKEREAAKRKALAADAANWELCAERCGCYCKGECACGCAIPPQLRERPIAPEECEGYQRKAV